MTQFFSGVNAEINQSVYVCVCVSVELFSAVQTAPIAL